MNLISNIFNTPRSFKIMSGSLAGHKIYMAPRHGIKKFLGTYEKEIVRKLNEEINEGDVCLDLGSHIGYLSLLMSKLTGTKGKVISVDPVKECTDFLEKSIELNKIKNIQVINCGVGEEDSVKKAYVFEDSGMANFSDSDFKIYEGSANVEFKIKKIDTLINDLGIEKVDFIKMDIEGYEYKALLGAKEVLKKKPKLLIEVHGNKHIEEILALLKEIGYKITDLNRDSVENKNLEEFEIMHLYAK